MFEKKAIRKIQIRLLPFLFVLYLVAFLDRVNIGFAALTMNEELAITSQQYGLAVGIFFFGYFLLEIPSNLLLHRIGARKWLARILISWGLVAAGTGLVQSAEQLYFARFLLGVAESGFFPGVLLYLTYWFPQREQARGIALFLTGMPLTSILGAPLSGLILDHAHWLGLGGWRWLLMLEGLPAVLGGLCAYVVLPDNPSEARFLTPQEKTWLSAELAREAAQKHQTCELSALQTLRHRRVWHLALIGFTSAIGFYSLSFWMPQVVQALSRQYSNTQVGLLVAIPHVVGLMAMLLLSRSSDRRLERRYHIALPLFVGAMGFLGLSTADSAPAFIALLSLAAFGLYGFFGPYFASASAFLTGTSAASGIALITSIGNLGGFAGPYAIGLTSRETGGFDAGLILAGMSLLFSGALALLLPGGTATHFSAPLHSVPKRR